MSTEQAASELKQQGAMEASRDPQSSVTAEDAERKILEETRAAGVDRYVLLSERNLELKCDFVGTYVWTM